MAALRVAGLSEETVALLKRRARDRGVEVTVVVRELAEMGLKLELAPPASGAAAEATLSDAAPLTGRDLLGSLETDDPDSLWI